MWERKFELDSTAYFINFLWNYLQVRCETDEVWTTLSSRSQLYEPPIHLPQPRALQRVYLPQPLACPPYLLSASRSPLCTHLNRRAACGSPGLSWQSP